MRSTLIIDGEQGNYTLEWRSGEETIAKAQFVIVDKREAERMFRRLYHLTTAKMHRIDRAE